MNLWIWTQKGWRTLLIRTALLVIFWLLLAFVVATEFYFTGISGPFKITWTEAVSNALRDWIPWMLLSPAVVVLAEIFRFDRKTWRRSLAVHFAACVLMAVVYEGVLTLTFPSPWIQAFRRAGSNWNNLERTNFTAGVPAQVGFAGSPAPGLVVNRGLVESTNLVFGPTNFLAALPFGVEADEVKALPAASVMGAGWSFFPGASPWMGLLHRTALRTQFTAPIYWCIICICWALNHWQESRERERRALELEASLTQANLRMLKMQLQPHFLFNALNAVSSLIHENPRAADDMVGSLSEFLRMSLDVSSKNEVLLRQELEFVNRYLEVQQARFGDRLQVYREIDEKTKDALVPPLILQPLVENSIRHGIESRESGGMVFIRAELRGDVLRLEVSDDGGGFKGGELLKWGKGIGLSNTKARLQALYGDRHQLRLMANHPTGACVRIEFPFHRDETKSKHEHTFTYS